MGNKCIDEHDYDSIDVNGSVSLCACPFMKVGTVKKVSLVKETEREAEKQMGVFFLEKASIVLLKIIRGAFL